LALSRYCLDTTAYSQFKRGHPPVVDLIDRAEWIGIPSIVLGELWGGFLQGSLTDRNRQELERFLTHPSVEEIVVDRAVAPLYGEISVDLRKAGTPIPVNDIWIAAAAAKTGAPVLTYDDHFGFVRRIDSIILRAPHGG
jgi:tRNA(fMet)-specific endonuclease VapC